MPTPHPASGGGFSIGRTYDLGWRTFKANYGALLAVVVVSALVWLGIWVANSILQAIPLIGLVFSLLISVFVSIPLAAGMAYAGVKACRRERVGAGDIFLGFTRYGSVVGIGVLGWLITIACIVPIYCMLAAGMFALMGASSSRNSGMGALAQVLTATGVLAALLMIVVITTRFSLATFVCLDPIWHAPGTMASMRISWRMTARPWLGLIGLMILNGLIALGSTLLLGIGLVLLGWPLILAAHGAAYCLIASPYFLPVCEECGYDLAGSTSATCPECDTPVPTRPGSSWMLLRYT